MVERALLILGCPAAAYAGPLAARSRADARIATRDSARASTLSNRSQTKILYFTRVEARKGNG